MKTIEIGKSGLQVPPLCLGTMGFSENPESARSWSADYPTSKAIVERALEKGLNFFDTAPVYALGSSEKALGQALKDLEVPREKVVIATKFYPRSQVEIEKGISMKEHIRNWLETSLSNLQTDYVDLYYLHMWDWNTPIEETIEALAELMEEGKVRAIGLSNAFAWQVAMANEKAIAMHKPTFSALQNQWNLISREDERALMECLAHYQMTPIPYASLAAGRLARPLGTVTRRSELDAYGAKKFSTQKDADARVIESLEKTAEELKAPMSSVALAWLRARGAVPLAGATRPEQVDGLAEAADLVLNAAQMAELEKDYVPHVLTGVLAEHTPEQDAYAAYGMQSMEEVKPL